MESRSARSLLQGSRQIFHKHYNWTGCSAPIIAPSFWGNHGCHSLLCSNVRKNFHCMKVLRFCIRLFTTEAISQISHIYDKFLSYDSSDHIFMHGSFRCHMHGFTSFRTWGSIMNTLPHEKKFRMQNLRTKTVLRTFVWVACQAPTWVHNPNGTSVCSAVLYGCDQQTSKHTDIGIVTICSILMRPNKLCARLPLPQRLARSLN